MGTSHGEDDGTEWLELNYLKAHPGEIPVRIHENVQPRCGHIRHNFEDEKQVANHDDKISPRPGRRSLLPTGWRSSFETTRVESESG